MRISDWSSDVCSSDLPPKHFQNAQLLVVDLCPRSQDRHTFPSFEHRKSRKAATQAEKESCVSTLSSCDATQTVHFTLTLVCGLSAMGLSWIETAASPFRSVRCSMSLTVFNLFRASRNTLKRCSFPMFC